MSYYTSSRSGRSATLPCVLTSGTEDALLVPRADSSRFFCSLTRFSAQGHTVHLNEEHPGIILHNNEVFVPYCWEISTGYFMLPINPPPSSAAFVKLPYELPVIDLNSSVNSGTYVSTLALTALTGAAADSSSSESGSNGIILHNNEGFVRKRCASGHSAIVLHRSEASVAQHSSLTKSFKRSKPIQSGAVQQHTLFEDSEPEDKARDSVR